MKKVLTLALALILILSLSACGKQETSSDASSTVGQTGTNTEGNATGSSATGTESKVEGTATEDGSSKEQSAEVQQPSATNSKSTGTQVGPTATESKESGVQGNVGVTASQAGPTGTSSKDQSAGNIRNPKNIEFEAEYVARDYSVYDENNICAPGVQFYDYGNGEYFCVILSAMFTSEPEDDDIKQRPPVIYKGKKYYRCGAGQSPAPATFGDKDITLDYEGVTIKLALIGDGKITVIESQSSKLPAGTLMAIEWNMLK